MFEITISAMNVDAQAPTKEGLEQGLAPYVTCQVIGGQLLPIANPQTKQPLVAPSSSVTFDLDKESALAFAEKIKNAAEALPDEHKLPRDFSIVQNPGDMDKVAEALGRFKG